MFDLSGRPRERRFLPVARTVLFTVLSIAFIACTIYFTLQRQVRAEVPPPPPVAVGEQS